MSKILLVLRVSMDVDTPVSASDPGFGFLTITPLLDNIVHHERIVTIGIVEFICHTSILILSPK